MLRRERLLARLSSALEADGVLLVAPAGYGKTTLVVDWVTEAGAEAAWLALNPAHRDARALASDLAAALARVHPVAAALSERIQAGEGPHEATAIWFELGRALEEAEDPAVLVVDDLDELVGAGEALALLDRLVADPLPAVHAILVGRRPPELPSRARKAAKGELAVLDTAELAFGDSEALALLDQLGVREPEARAAILERAGGWPLAVALFAGRSTGSAATGQPRAPVALAEFIEGELLGDMSAEERALLDACAVPSYFDGDIAAELTGRADAGSTLLVLETRTQLIEAIGDGPWLRMHALLREHCLAKLVREEPARLAGVRERAAHALARRGELDEATALALDAGSWRLARELIEEQAEPLSGRGAWSTLAGWLGCLPREVVREAPGLALLEVRVAIRLGRLPQAHELLDRLDIALLAPSEQAQAFLYRAVAFRQARRLDDARREHRRARTLIEEHEPSESAVRIEADLEEGITLGMAGDLVPSVRLLRRCAEAAEAKGSARLAAEGYQNLGLALQFAGQLGSAQVAMGEARRRWEHLGERELRLLTLNNEATTTQALGDLDAAERAYLEISEQAEPLGIRRLGALGALGLADIARDRGDLAAAIVRYDQAHGIAREIGHAGVEAASAFGKAMSLREQGLLHEARTLLEHNLQVTQEQGTEEFASRSRIGLAGVLLSEARPGEAHAALREVLEGVGGGFQRRQLALLMRATAEFRLGRQAEAEQALIELQHLVEALGYDQFMVAEARLCADLLTDERVVALPGAYFPGLLQRARGATRPAPPQEPGEVAADFVVRAFGAPTVVRPGASSGLGWRGERSLELLLLLLESGRAMSREEIAGKLWPEASPSRLPGLFHTSLHRLRGALGERVVIHKLGTYALDPLARFDYDVHRFEEHLVEADRAPDEQQRTRSLGAAVTLYRGEFAPSIDSPWARTVRWRLEGRYLGARLTLAKHALACGRYEEAITHAELAHETDPLNQEALRHLIAAQVGAGHSDLALRAYRSLRAILEEEEGGDLSGETLRALELVMGEARSRS